MSWAGISNTDFIKVDDVSDAIANGLTYAIGSPPSVAGTEFITKTQFLAWVAASSVTTSSGSGAGSDWVIKSGTTLTPPAPATPTITYGGPLCKNNNNQVYYTVIITNPPSGGSVTLIPNTTGTGTMALGTAGTVIKMLFDSTAAGSTATWNNFTLQLKDSGGTVVASATGSMSYQSFWTSLSACSGITPDGDNNVPL